MVAALVAVVVVLGAVWFGLSAAWQGTFAEASRAGAGNSGAVEPGEDRGEGTSDDPGTPAPAPSPTPTPPPPDVVFSLVAAGDVLPHLAVNASARTSAGYDFAPLLAPLDPWVAGADLALCHLEVPVAPAGTAPSGYPLFGAPAELVTALARQGWDGCSTASNHSLDRGMAGVQTTLAALDGAGLGHVGTARDAAEAERPQLYRLTREGRTVTVAHLAGTYGTNGVPVPADAPWSVTGLDAAALVEQATAARAAGADLVVVSMHCCVEYAQEPAEQGVQVAQALADSGQVDLVIGHHAHVPQPVVRLAGGPAGAGMWVFHGLGNFVSNQDAACCPAATSSGLLATAHVVKPADGPARVTGVEWTGVTVDRPGGHRVHALPDVAAGTPTLSAAEVAARAQRVAAAAGDQAPQRTAPTTPTGPPPEVVRRTG